MSANQSKSVKSKEKVSAPVKKQKPKKVVFKNYFKEINSLFFEREWEVNQIQYAVLMREHVLLKGQPGCLTGDSELKVRRGNKKSAKDMALKELYEKWNGKFNGRGFRKDLPTYTLSLKDGYIGYHEIDDVIYSGVKKVYLLITEAGKEIKVTDIHPFKVPDNSKHIGVTSDKDGFVKLKDLSVGDVILVRGEKEFTGRGKNKERRVVYGVEYHPYAWIKSTICNGKKYEYKQINYARLVVEANMNNLSVKQFITALKSGNSVTNNYKYLSSDLVVHHKDLNPMNDNLSNLQVMSKEAHDKLHNDISILNLPNPSPVEDSVAFIQELGEVDTYDIIMKEPYRNFIANDFIVHNTAKSMLALKVFNGIEGAEVYKNQFTRMQDDSYVFGPQLLEEFKQGRIVHNTEGTLITANFGFLDEFFNASEETLVATLEPLNERTFTRPHQKEECPLITAIMTTNQEREEEKELRAVYDRIIFRSDVKELADPQKRIEMYKSFLSGHIKDYQPKIKFSDLIEAIEEFDKADIDFSDSMFTIYDTILTEYENQLNVRMSPRRKNKLLQIVRASAFLRDSDAVTVEDIEAIKFGLVEGGDVKSIGYFDSIFEKVKQSLANAEIISKMDALFTLVKEEDSDVSKKYKVAVGVSKKCEKFIGEVKNDPSAAILVPMAVSLKERVEVYIKELKEDSSIEEMF